MNVQPEHRPLRRLGKPPDRSGLSGADRSEFCYTQRDFRTINIVQ